MSAWGRVRARLRMLQQEIWELNGHISTLDQENRLMRARNERLEKEIEELLKAK